MTRLMKCWKTQLKKHHLENKIRYSPVEECGENKASHGWQKHFEAAVWVVFTNKTVQSQRRVGGKKERKVTLHLSTENLTGLW